MKIKKSQKLLQFYNKKNQIAIQIDTWTQVQGLFSTIEIQEFVSESKDLNKIGTCKPLWRKHITSDHMQKEEEAK